MGGKSIIYLTDKEGNVLPNCCVFYDDVIAGLPEKILYVGKRKVASFSSFSGKVKLYNFWADSSELRDRCRIFLNKYTDGIIRVNSARDIKRLIYQGKISIRR